MKILIIGFQRSGTTLMRRLMISHPQVKRLYHEAFLLRQYQTKEALMAAVRGSVVDPINTTWGEKTPFYPNIRKIPVVRYCNTWNEYFENESRILHIIRHPIDVAFSVINKNKNRNISHPLNLYCAKMEKTIPAVNKIKNTFTFKYEDLLLNPDDIIPRIFDFCGLKSDIDFRKQLKNHRNKKYQKLDKSRAFAYKRKDFKIKKDLRKVIKIANTIDGPKYESN